MAAIAVTYTFTNGTVADGSNVNTNFTDITGGLSGGTADLTVGSIVLTTKLAATSGGTGTGTYTLGDLLYSSATNTLAKLTGNITTTRKFLTQTGDGANSAAPVWNAIVAGDMPALTGDITTTAGTVATTLSNTVQTKTGDYTALVSDDLILCNTNTINITMYAASAARKPLRIVKIGSDANVVTITRAGSDTFEGATTLTLPYQYDEILITSDGSAKFYVTSFRKNPKLTVYTSGSGTFTTAVGTKYIVVKMVGGGGGGGGGGTVGTGGTGGVGGNSTFGSSLLTATGGGAGGGTASAGGAGGTPVTVASPALTILTAVGGQGSGGGGSTAGGDNGYSGGYSALGGGGAGGAPSAGGGVGTANTGGGGGGGGLAVAGYGGSGGGSGGYIEAMIINPSATYAYAVGGVGSAGSAGTSGSAGGAGAVGQISVTEYFA